MSTTAEAPKSTWPQTALMLSGNLARLRAMRESDGLDSPCRSVKINLQDVHMECLLRAAKREEMRILISPDTGGEVSFAFAPAR